MSIQILVILIRNLASSHFDHLVINLLFTKTYLAILRKQKLSWSYHLFLISLQLCIFLISKFIMADIAGFYAFLQQTLLLQVLLHRLRGFLHQDFIEVLQGTLAEGG